MTTVVLGLDGASFELIRPWIEDGELPNLSKIYNEGVAMDMQSCLPPVTCPNWQAYATGTNPGKLGVFWWEYVDRDANTIRHTSTAAEFDGTAFWHYVDGPKAIVNLPTSYPPEEIDGIHIAGGPDADNTGYTNPSSVEAELEAEYGYRVHPSNRSQLTKDNPKSECVAEIHDLIDSRFDVARDYVRDDEYEFVHVTIFYLNVLQHFFWDDDVVKQAWKRIDERVGELLEQDTLNDLFVMSDHGANEITTTFSINTWLEEHGYLHKQSAASGRLHSLGLTKERLKPLLERLGVLGLVKRLLPRQVRMQVPNDDGSVRMSGKDTYIDWDASTAVASGQGPVYVLADDPSERERIREELLERLDGLRDDDGRPVIDTAYEATDVYDGPYVDSGPDIVLDQAAGVHIEGSVGGGEIFGQADRWRGENKDTGLFMCHGPNVAGNESIEDMHILDLAPTILALYGFETPEWMDGTARTALLDVDASELEPLESSATSRDAMASEDREAVADRLSDLGYIE